MWFVIIGVAMLIMNMAGVGPVGSWIWADRWWAFLLPFLCAIAWWTWSDVSGRTQRKAMEKVDAKREARRQKNLDNLGLGSSAKKKR